MDVNYRVGEMWMGMIENRGSIGGLFELRRAAHCI